MEKYTSLSQEAYERAIFSSLTPQEAAQWITGASCFRTLPEKLLKFYPGTEEQLKTVLRTGFYELHPLQKERESLRKNLSSWFLEVKGIDNRTISREYALEMCFLLRLTLKQSNEFLRSVNGEGLHYRNLREFAAAFALNHGLTCIQYIKLLERLKIDEIEREQTGAVSENYTRANERVVKELNSEEELQVYILEHKQDFSDFHNTSYAYFMEMLEVLKHGGTDASVGELVEENLYRRFVRKNQKLSSIAKSIRAGWPDETHISKMKNREQGVNRKVLILLYLASGGEVSKTEELEENLDAFLLSNDSLDDAQEDADFEGLQAQIDAMLVECGFAPLDPRLPFDWMVLFCMATGDLFDLDERFGTFLETLFGNESQR